jgi:MerR family transcriptional regulator, thiopeptide resistance regulator
VLNNLGRNAEPSARQLLQLIEVTVAMNEPMTPEQFAELKEELQRQLRELSEEDFAALSLVPDAASGSTKGQS